MMLQDRQKQILEALVREYVKTARPVSSKDLRRICHFPFSSATIRNDFQILHELGFLSQPHISAGRVPTDKAYRFYINEHEHQKNKEARHSGNTSLRQLAEAAYSDEEFLRSAASVLSEFSGSFAMAGIVDDRLFFKHGFSEALDEPEFSDRETARDFGRYVDEFEKSVEALCAEISRFHHPEVFIGRENPVKRSKEYGMVVYAYERDTDTGKKRQLVSIIGPKRMDYEKNISLMEDFDDIVRELYSE